jgi:thioredoxin reductase
VSAADAQAVIIGGGPAGLAAALELRRRRVADVLVLDREQEPGGIPRHAKHQGFGLRDLHRAMSGPRYARRYTELARDAGAGILTEAMVTGWSAAGELEVTSPDGRATLTPDAVILATGCRERPRSARSVAGSRPQGVMTTATLQQLVYLVGARPGRHALIVGAEHVSFSALMTLAHGGARAVGMITALPRHQSLAIVRLGAAVRYRAPLWTRTEISAIRGQPRVEAAALTDLESGRKREVACDTVVFTADWIPDHELAVLGRLDLDPGTRGPAVDTALRTSRVGTFAAGNVLHGAEPADIAAISGRHAAAAAARYLEDDGWPTSRVPICCRAPLRWIAPNVVVPRGEPPPRDRFLLRSDAFHRRAGVVISQGDRELWSGPPRRLVPGRSASLPANWMGAVDPTGPAVEVSIRQHEA